MLGARVHTTCATRRLRGEAPSIGTRRATPRKLLRIISSVNCPRYVGGVPSEDDQ
jgi:hypothetical protein